MEITYDEKRKQFRVKPPGKKDSGKNEMTFDKPKGLVPLVGESRQTAAYYVAAAGGEWVSDSVSMVIVVL